MKRNITAAFISVIMLVSLMLLSGCGSAAEKASDLAPKSLIRESAYFPGEDGAYNVVLIVENNGMLPIEYGIIEGIAKDKDGNPIKSVKDGEETLSFSLSYYRLGKGEKTAICMDSGLQMDSILDYFEEVPAKFEWEQSYVEKGAKIVPYGISVTACEDVDTGEYGDEHEFMVTLHNDSETDYVYDHDAVDFIAGDKYFSAAVVAVYRNADGEIKDAVKMDPYEPEAKDIPAGGDVSMPFHSSHFCEDSELTPEYYFSVDVEYDVEN